MTKKNMAKWLADENLSVYDVVVLLIIDLTKKKGVSELSYKDMEQYRKGSRMTLFRSIKKLQKMGYISIEEQYDDSTKEWGKPRYRIEKRALP